jgi:hypothetical protein
MFLNNKKEIFGGMHVHHTTHVCTVHTCEGTKVPCGIKINIRNLHIHVCLLCVTIATGVLVASVAMI